ncbi:MAG: NAD(+)/NADH kinase [Anaerolineae bacterium]|nr:NAD(+)/NADH kinase [Anaerolineae bacterium]
MPNRAFVALNPVAGTHDPGEVRDLIERRFRDALWRFTFHTTEKDGDLSSVVRQHADQGFDLYVAAGGDGTVSGVAGGIAGTEYPLGIIPTGTGNLLVRELGIPQAPEKAMELLVGSHGYRTLDALRRVGQDRYYFLNVSLGTSAMWMREVARDTKRKMGIWAYILAGVRTFMGAQPARFSLSIDGETRDIKASEVLIVHDDSLGLPELSFGHGVHLDDGQVDVCVVRAKTVGDYLDVAWQVVTGHYKRGSRFRCYVARQTVRVRSRQRLPVQADGDFIGWQSVGLELVPHAVRVVTPKA